MGRGPVRPRRAPTALLRPGLRRPPAAADRARLARAGDGARSGGVGPDPPDAPVRGRGGHRRCDLRATTTGACPPGQPHLVGPRVRRVLDAGVPPGRPEARDLPGRAARRQHHRRRPGARCADHDRHTVRRHRLPGRLRERRARALAAVGLRHHLSLRLRRNPLPRERMGRAGAVVRVLSARPGRAGRHDGATVVARSGPDPRRAGLHRLGFRDPRSCSWASPAWSPRVSAASSDLACSRWVSGSSCC